MGSGRSNSSTKAKCTIRMVPRETIRIVTGDLMPIESRASTTKQEKTDEISNRLDGKDKQKSAAHQGGYPKKPASLGFRLFQLFFGFNIKLLFAFLRMVGNEPTHDGHTCQHGEHLAEDY